MKQSPKCLRSVCARECLYAKRQRYFLPKAALTTTILRHSRSFLRRLSTSRVSVSLAGPPQKPQCWPLHSSEYVTAE
eukprot:scaffold2660_cov257-Pinguiococcus_pyrenoidosus.AAC.6